MNRHIITALFIAGVMSASADDSVPAFPGAEGHGRYVTGGRGGQVIHVTNLNDSGAGSLREALGKSGKRIIVFDVSGDIHLKLPLAITRGDVTVLGQTAPGGGITICDQTVEIKADNVILRFLRVRRGELVSTDDGADAAWGRKRKNIILDHLSLSWSTDEVGSWYDNRNFTMQWCVLAEGLASGHTKGTHSYGGIWGGKNASFHHNMIAHVNNRVPRINGARYAWTGYDTSMYPNVVEAERVDLRNNVYYNWGNGNGCYGGPGGGYCNIVNNYYKAGPATKNKTRVLQASVCSSGNGDSKHPELYDYASRYYIDGNYVTAASVPDRYDWKGVTYDSGLATFNGEKYIKDANNYYVADESDVYNSSSVRYVRMKLGEPIDAGVVTTHSAKAAFEKMLSYGGASLMRDGHDVRYMEEARTGTVTFKGSLNGWKGIIDKCIDVIPGYVGTPYPWSTPEATAAPVDSDGDGMPDEWETLNGLDPNKNDASLYTVDPRGWYTNIEVYANSLVEHIMKGGNSDAESVVDEYYPVLAQSGIDDINCDTRSEVIKIEYYNLNGVRLAEPAQGVNIRRLYYADGHVETDKVVK